MSVRSMRNAFWALSVAALSLPSIAHAEARLLNSTPAQGATIDAPAKIELQFSEAVDQKMSNIDLRDVDGTSVTVSPMETKDPKTYTVVLGGALPSGTYSVAWTAVDGTGRKTNGGFGFTVK